MNSIFFFQGFLVGLVLCAPFGPIGVLAVRRTLVAGRLAGAVSLLGASTADGLYCALAGLGIQDFTSYLSEGKLWFQILASLLLLGIGMRIFTARPAKMSLHLSVNGLLESFTGPFLLVLANPLSLLVFGALFTALGVHGWKADTLPTLLLVAGVFLGSVTWAPILSGGARHFTKKLNPRRMHLVDRFSGGLIGAAGLVLGIGALIP
jgi:threonine/homoserine/homoserine lactone efflux protein